MKKLPLLVLFVLVSQLAGIIGSVFTTPNISSWYSFLVKPFFSPPNWIFAPVWISLYTLMGIAAYLVYQQKTKTSRNGLIFFGIQLVLNSLWSILFFGLKSPIAALFEIIILWTTILVTTVKFYKVNKIAGYLMIPYILWVTFASFLNLAIVLLN